MKKKILFTAFNLDIGGVEKCLVNLVNNLNKDKYDITIYLQVKEGTFLNKVNETIEVKGYNLTKIKNKYLKKIVNIFKYLKILLTNFHKYDISICYAPGYVPSAILALISSKNNIAWMHTNILTYMDNYLPYKSKKISTEKKAKKFLNRMFFRKFNKKIFVSQNALCAYLSIYPQDKNSCTTIYNLIDYKEINKLSKETLLEKNKKYTFLNVGRHTEYDKRLSRLINACEKLKKDKYDFELLLVGSGVDTENYKKIVKAKKLDKYIKFIGKKTNPYPYFKISNAFVLSSAFEGLPTTYLESLVLNLPIITTDVSDAQILIKDRYGLVMENNDDAIYYGMKEAIDKKIELKKCFDPKKYNEDIIKKLESEINCD